MTPHLTHVALFVHDVTRTIDFYRRYVGLHVVHERVDGDVRVAWLSERSANPLFVIVAIQATPGPAEPPPRMAHLGYDAGSRAAVDAVAARAATEGLLDEGPLDAGPIVGYLCIVRDPDGNLVEFSHGQSIDPQRSGA